MRNNVLIVVLCCALLVVAVTSFSIFGKRENNISLSSNPSPSTLEAQERSTPRDGIRAGDRARDFSFTTIDGQTVALSSLRGQPVIISFALTVGCGACVVEAISIQEAQKQIPSLRVVQLAVDPRETVDDLRDFRDLYGNPDWFIGFDAENVIAEQYEVRAIDTTILINSEGVIVYRDDGDPIEAETIIQKLTLL